MHEHVQVPELAEVDVAVSDRRNRRTLVRDRPNLGIREKLEQVDEFAGEEQVSPCKVTVLLLEDGNRANRNTLEPCTYEAAMCKRHGTLFRDEPQKILPVDALRDQGRRSSPRVVVQHAARAAEQQLRLAA